MPRNLAGTNNGIGADFLQRRPLGDSSPGIFCPIPQGIEGILFCGIFPDFGIVVPKWDSTNFTLIYR